MDGGGIFGSWVKYGGNMEGVGKCEGEVREDVLGVLGDMGYGE